MSIRQSFRPKVTLKKYFIHIGNSINAKFLVLEKDFFLGTIYIQNYYYYSPKPNTTLTINDKDGSFLASGFLVSKFDSALKRPFTEKEKESDCEKVEYVKEG